jgi:hypothetical protein
MQFSSHFDKFNEIYARYLPVDAPARIFLHVPSWPGPSTSRLIVSYWCESITKTNRNALTADPESAGMALAFANEFRIDASNKRY